MVRLKGRILPLALVMVFGLSLVVAAQTVEISVLLNPGTLGNEYINWLGDVWFPQFEAENPDIKVNVQLLSGNRLDLVATAVAGGVPFDIVDAAHTLPMIEGVGRGWYLPLNDFLDTWEYTDETIPTVWAHVTWDDDILALPYTVPPRTIAYNKLLFEMAGLDPSTPPQSWEEFLEAANRLTRTQDDRVIQRGYYMLTSTGEMAMLFELLAANNGVDILSADYRAPLFNSPGGLEVLNFMRDLWVSGNPVGYDLPNDPVQASFLNGNTAMIRAAGAGLVTAVRDQAQGMVDLGIFMPRRSPQHQPATTASINSMAIMRFTKHPEAAWKVLAHMYERESLEMLALVRGQQVPRRDVIETAVHDTPELQPFFEVLEYLVPRPKWPSGGGYTYTSGLGEPVSQAVFGEIAPEMALDEAERRIRILLDAFWAD